MFLELSKAFKEEPISFNRPTPSFAPITLFRLNKLIEAFNGAVFFEASEYPDEPEKICYVKSHSPLHIIYLGVNFFKQSAELGVESQPSLLIHEMSHFKDVLGLHDTDENWYRKYLKDERIQ